MFLAVFATIRGNDSGWTSALILGCYAVSAILFAAFVAVERRRKFPMFDLRLFREPDFRRLLGRRPSPCASRCSP